jgi:hypothetical protein
MDCAGVGGEDVLATIAILCECFECSDMSVKADKERAVERLNTHPTVEALAREILQFALSLSVSPPSFSLPSPNTSQYCYWFSLGVFEREVRRREDRRGEIYTLLRGVLTAHHSHLTPFAMNKIAKILVEIGIMRWPQEDPNFLQDLLSITQNRETTGTLSPFVFSHNCDASQSLLTDFFFLLGVGLTLLRCLGEYFGSADVATSRLDILKRHLTNELPAVFHVCIQSKLLQLLSCAILSQVLTSLLEATRDHLRMSRGGEAEQIASASLDVTLQFLSWIPLDSVFSLPLSSLLFDFVDVGGVVVGQNSAIFKMSLII